MALALLIGMLAAAAEPSGAPPVPAPIASAAAATPGPSAEPTPTGAALQRAPDSGNAVIRYDPSYFAEFRPNTAMDMVFRLPGFSFDQGAQVRGFAGAAGNVLINGDRPTAKQDNLQNNLNRIPATQVDHIDVVRGGAPGIDMQGRTVLANVVLKKGSGTTGVASVGNTFVYDGRMRPDTRLEYTRTSDGKKLELSLLGIAFWDDGAGDGPRTRVDGSGAPLIFSRNKTKAGGVQLNSTVAYEAPLAGGKFRINLYGQYQPYSNDEDDHLITPPGLQTLRDRQKRLNSELGIHFEKTLDPKTSIEALAIQQLNHSTFTSHFVASGEDDLFEESDTSRETIGRAILRYRPSSTLSAEVSAEGAYNSQTSDSAFAFNGTDIPLPAGHVTVSEKRGELAGQLTWKPQKTLTVETGVRAEISQISSTGDVVLTKSLFFPKPRALVTWAPDDRNQVRLRVEREVGQLNFGDFVASSSLSAGGVVRAGNPDLNPQDAWVFEAAYEKHIGGAVFVLTGRHQVIRDVVDRIPIFSASGVFDAPGNIGSARENDLLVELTLPLDRIIKHAQIKGSGTLRDSKVTDPTTGEERRISGQHPWDYEIHFTHDVPKLNLSWGIDLFNRWTETYYRFNEIDVYSLKSYVGGFAEYKPNPRWSFRLEGGNLSARGFQRILKVYNGPRNTNGIAFVDDRHLHVGPSIRLRIRRNFTS